MSPCFSFLILNEPRQCCNKHLFCETCIFAWSMTYGENSQKCPVCRSEQSKYEANSDIRRVLWDKQVSCPEDKCEHKVRSSLHHDILWNVRYICYASTCSLLQSCLRAFLMHSHGKTRFSNEHVDLESLRPERPEGARLIVLPNISVQGGTRTERVTSLRDQIHHVSDG